MIEMNIESVRVSLVNSQRMVLLKEKTGERYLPIWIGVAEADAIAAKLQETKFPRPLTHDLLSSMIDALEGKVESVVINELKNDTFYARIIMTRDGKRFEVDSRPSDAMALAVRVGAPILVEESVLTKVGLCEDDENWRPASSEDETADSGRVRSQAYKPVSKEDLKRMSAYSDFLNTLNLDDLNKRQS